MNEMRDLIQIVESGHCDGVSSLHYGHGQANVALTDGIILDAGLLQAIKAYMKTHGLDIGVERNPERQPEDAIIRILAKDAIRLIKSHIRGDRLLLYRAVNLRDLSALRRHELGTYWSLDAERAIPYNAIADRFFRFCGEVSTQDIDWRASVIQQVVAEEEEVVVHSGADVTIVDIEYDRRPFESSLIGRTLQA